MTKPTPGGISERNIDPRLPSHPDELLKSPSWVEVTHPKAAQKGHRNFKNSQTGEMLRFDQAKPEKSGHRGKDHWHRTNPNSTGDHDLFLDAQGNPVPKNSEASHLYSPH